MFINSQIKHSTYAASSLYFSGTAYQIFDPKRLILLSRKINEFPTRIFKSRILLPEFTFTINKFLTKIWLRLLNGLKLTEARVIWYICLILSKELSDVEPLWKNLEALLLISLSRKALVHGIRAKLLSTWEQNLL